MSKDLRETSKKILDDLQKIDRQIAICEESESLNGLDQLQKARQRILEAKKVNDRLLMVKELSDEGASFQKTLSTMIYYVMSDDTDMFDGVRVLEQVVSRIKTKMNHLQETMIQDNARH